LGSGTEVVPFRVQVGIPLDNVPESGANERACPAYVLFRAAFAAKGGGWDIVIQAARSLSP